MVTNYTNRRSELIDLENELLEIEHFFVSANFKDGNELLTSWLQKFENYLSKYYPQKFAEFQNSLGNKRTIRRTGSLSGIDTFRAQIGNSVVPLILNIKNNLETEMNSSAQNLDKKKRVFIIHGRNMKAYDALHAFLLELRLDPIDFSEALTLTKKTAPTIPEILNAAFSHAQAMIVLMTPDDLGGLRKELWKENEQDDERKASYRCRQNVIYEAGMAMAIDPNRVIFAELGQVKRFTDLPVHFVNLLNSPAFRQDMVMRLRAAGCTVDNSSGSPRWLETGDFSGALKFQ